MPHPPSAELAIVDLGACDACGLCLPICPTAAITLRREGLRIIADACTGCRKCVAPCPVAALHMVARA